MNALQQLRNIFGLKHVSSEEHAGRTALHDIARHLDSRRVRTCATSSQHEDRNWTRFNHGSHAFGITAILCLDNIGAKLGRDAGVQHQPLSIPCILNSCATSDRFNDQGQAEMLTLARDPRNALDFASFKFRITTADNHKRDDRVRACPEGVFRLCNEATAKGVRRKLAGCAHRGSPVKPGDEAWQVLLCRHLRKLSNHSQVEKKGVGLAFQEAANLAPGILRPQNRPENKPVIECHDQAAPAGAENTAKADGFPVSAHGKGSW